MQTILKCGSWASGWFLVLFALSDVVYAATAGAPGPAAPGPAAPGVVSSPVAPELSTGALGAGIVILFGAMFVFFDYRRRKAKAQK